jgi:hypothetical protein
MSLEVNKPTEELAEKTPKDIEETSVELSHDEADQVSGAFIVRD